jgi:hypothetical protein
MSRRAGGNHPYQVPGSNGVGSRSAYTRLRFFLKRIHPAGTHRTVPAAYTQLAEPALGLLLFKSVPNGFVFRFGQMTYYLLCRLVRTTFLCTHKQILTV